IGNSGAKKGINFSDGGKLNEVLPYFGRRMKWLRGLCRRSNASEPPSAAAAGYERPLRACSTAEGGGGGTPGSRDPADRFVLRRLKARLIMPVHRRVGLGVTHEQIDEERNPDHGREVVVEPLFAPLRLEPERDRIGGAAEQRDGQRIGEADPERADLGGE